MKALNGKKTRNATRLHTSCKNHASHLILKNLYTIHAEIFSTNPDFYGSSKGCDIFFFIFPPIPDYREYSVDDLVPYRI